MGAPGRHLFARLIGMPDHVTRYTGATSACAADDEAILVWETLLPRSTTVMATALELATREVGLKRVIVVPAHSQSVRRCLSVYGVGYIPSKNRRIGKYFHIFVCKASATSRTINLVPYLVAKLCRNRGSETSTTDVWFEVTSSRNLPSRPIVGSEISIANRTLRPLSLGGSKCLQGFMERIWRRLGLRQRWT